MSLQTERCGRCGAALVSMETDPEAIRGARCRGCALRDERRQSRTIAATLVCASLLAAFSAWQMLIA